MPPRIELPPKQCPQCDLWFDRDSCQRISDFRVKKFCSLRCAKLYMVGPRHSNWKGGTKTRPDGYVRDSRTGQYVHRLVMEKELGRPLLSSEHVHHVDEVRFNNVPQNLKLTTNSEHRKHHVALQKRNRLGQFA